MSRWIRPFLFSGATRHRCLYCGVDFSSAEDAYTHSDMHMTAQLPGSVYSQNGEEALILDLFKDRQKGRFLDIGAYDGRTFSNTRRLAEMGWGGVLVEPSPEAFIALLKTYGADPNMTLIHAAVGCERLLAVFHNSPDAVSTTSEENRRKWEKDAQFNGSFYVPVLTIQQILDQFGRDFDFLNIDTEGTSADIFLRLPDGWHPKVICVEHDGREVELANHAQAHGYRVQYLDGNNIIFAM